MEHDIELLADGLRLRPFRLGDPRDVDVVRRAADDEACQRFSSSLRAASDVDGATAWLAARAESPTRREWLVEDSATTVPLGRIGLHRNDPDAALEIGYWTLPEARGRGVARRAVRAVARFGHEILGERRLALVHEVDNVGSCRVALGASFRRESVERASLPDPDGVLHDAHRHVRLAEDPWDPLPPPFLPYEPVSLDADGLVLEGWTDTDAEIVLETAQDPVIQQWNPLTAGDPAQALAWVRRLERWDEWASWAIRDEPGGRALGAMNLHHIEPAHRTGEAGYWVAPHARGRGVAPRALEAATGYAFDSLGLVRVQLFHAVGNTASCRVAQKGGFALEGTARSSYRYGDGALHDEHLHGRLAVYL